MKNLQAQIQCMIAQNLPNSLSRCSLFCGDIALAIRHWRSILWADKWMDVDKWALAAHACNPSYLGVRDQEDPGSKPAWANNSWDPILKNPSQKNGLVEWLKV
jgi:hypothetical protein